MIVKLKHLKPSGQMDGPAMILFDGPVQVAKIRGTANGGVRLLIEQEDEFGHVSLIEMDFEKEDVDVLKTGCL